MSARQKTKQQRAPSRPMSLASRVYELLKRDIISCVLSPGEQIAQAQLAERYCAGITPIREALQRLAREGLIWTMPRFGYVVTPITLSDVDEIFELRIIVETAAVRLAAARASKEQLEEIMAHADFTYVHKDSSSYSRFQAHNAAFHRAIANASGNRRLSEWSSQALDELTRVLHLDLNFRDNAEEMRKEHLALAKALSCRDATRAERLMQEQIAFSKRRVLEALMASPALGASPRTLGQVVQLKPKPSAPRVGRSRRGSANRDARR